MRISQNTWRVVTMIVMVLIMFVSITSQALAGDTLLDKTGKVEGNVIDNHGRPLRGVSVYIENTSYSTRTDAKGYYCIDYVLPSSRDKDYTLWVAKDGYQKQNYTFSIGAKDEVTKNFKLKRK
jgi:hypothetical protein